MTKMNFLEQLEECVKNNDVVEILTDSREVSGVLSAVGEDYIGIKASSERTIQVASKGQDGTVENEDHIEVFQLEIFVKLEDIRAVSRVMNKTIK